ncbi:hypothetical protein DFJ58DRAFT_250592 [Suillus subalutaceus]|uniref:uncharacterized protein n=1 Tax=Suillus subalutaceus TaxID=48586 RepID=UPI001B86F44E|nr:uncharacterized protein DFJ58DRAFT_250592 [Suillus subalutaceus]KAG1861561.1 hypothetical protein DFJ58DRAFT_250592 [Suillus subalutaceus]
MPHHASSPSAPFRRTSIPENASKPCGNQTNRYLTSMRTWAMKLVLSFASHAKLTVCNTEQPASKHPPIPPRTYRSPIRRPQHSLRRRLHTTALSNYRKTLQQSHPCPRKRGIGLQYSKSLFHTILRAHPALRVRFVHRGRLSAERLVHVPNRRDHRVSKVRSRLHSSLHGRPGALDVETKHVALTKHASSSTDSLVIRNVPDDTENDEQAWLTEETASTPHGMGYQTR